MDRPTKLLSVQGHEVVAKSYATALEANNIQQAYFKGTKLEVVGDQPKISEFNPGVQFEVYKELIAQMVISLDGNAENIVERCLELPNDVFDSIVSELDTLVSKKKN